MAKTYKNEIGSIASNIVHTNRVRTAGAGGGGGGGGGGGYQFAVHFDRKEE